MHNQDVDKMMNQGGSTETISPAETNPLEVIPRHYCFLVFSVLVV